MKSFLVIVLFVGLLGLAMAAEGDLELLKRILSALKEKKGVAVETGAEMNLERRNSYGIMWKGGRERTLSIYLQKSTGCENPCEFKITFQDEDGKTVGNELDAEFKNSVGGRVDFTESEIMDSPLGDSKDKTGGNGQNAVGGSRGRLPDHLIVRVCRIEKRGIRACNKRPVDTSQDHDTVFFKTVKDNYNPTTNV